MLARAGLIPSGTRSFFTDLPSPLGMSACEHLQMHLVSCTIRSVTGWSRRTARPLSV